MLKVRSPFPHAGSDALLEGAPVRIIQVHRDGTRLVTGKGISRIVPLEELFDPSVPEDPLARWLDDRVEYLPIAAEFTPAEDLFADYVSWCRMLKVAELNILGPVLFNAALLECNRLGTLKNGKKCFDLALCAPGTKPARAVHRVAA